MEDLEKLLNESSEEIIEISTSQPRTELPEWRKNLPKNVPVMPLRGVVLFPGTVAPLTVERGSSQKLLDDLMPDSRLVALSTQKDESVETPKKKDIYRLGVLGNVLRVIEQEEDHTLILIQIVERIELTRIIQEKPYLRSEFKILENIFPRNTPRWKASIRNLQESAEEYLAVSPHIPEEALQALASIESPAILTDFLATNLTLEVEHRQEILEEVHVGKRAEKVQQALNNQLHIAELQAKLRDDVEDEFTDAQRRAYLREQMRAIQRELGEDDGSEELADDLRTRIEAAELPEECLEQANKELNRLTMIPPASPEHSVLVSYLETVAELPWNKFSEENDDIEHAEKVLDADHFGLKKVKRRLLEFLAVRTLNPHGKGPILCLLGPPGVGKTSLGRSIASALGRKFIRLSVGGVKDESEIRGHRRTYIGSMPGRLIQEIRRCGTKNPVIMLDEIDKIGADFRGDPASALLEVLDPNQNDRFMDRFLDLPFDLSQVIFIATANTADPIPAPLLDRMEILDIAGYTTEEKLQIARRYLVKRQLKENGLKAKQCKWSAAALRFVIEDYTREAGVRGLNREIGSVCRYVAAEVVSNPKAITSIDVAKVEEILGPPKYARETKMRTSAPGVVNGLAYTPFGGEVLNIEAVRFRGKGEIKLTGQIGDVMKESVQAAWSLVKTRADYLKIDPEDFKKFDVHVHVPAGAIPKDGPSAGCAMFIALASLFTGGRVNKDIAMTGEINLRGDVLPIGGLKEKALGAVQAGIKTIYIPQLNEKDIPEIPEATAKKLKVISTARVEEIWEACVS